MLYTIVFRYVKYLRQRPSLLSPRLAPPNTGGRIPDLSMPARPLFMSYHGFCAVVWEPWVRRWYIVPNVNSIYYLTCVKFTFVTLFNVDFCWNNQLSWPLLHHIHLFLETYQVKKAFNHAYCHYTKDEMWYWWKDIFLNQLG